MEYVEVIKNASTDAWMLFKAYIGIKNDKSEWDSYISDCQKIYEKYKDTQAEEYIRNYITMVITPEIERLSRRK